MFIPLYCLVSTSAVFCSFCKKEKKKKKKKRDRFVSISKVVLNVISKNMDCSSWLFSFWIHTQLNSAFFPHNPCWRCSLPLTLRKLIRLCNTIPTWNHFVTAVWEIISIFPYYAASFLLLKCFSWLPNANALK